MTSVRAFQRFVDECVGRCGYCSNTDNSGQSSALAEGASGTMFASNAINSVSKMNDGFTGRRISSDRAALKAVTSGSILIADLYGLSWRTPFPRALPDAAASRPRAPAPAGTG